ncbi:T9SS type B sorting domain-containing protein [Flaviaesturariibacter flavus]|uniref:T9SS type B sorting domain-containing protein n=1 Tax=Flaviaesturariibacter flavus TaxID=2502780 RepID=A0A4R1B6N0_9BACT|nr:PKD domain-containing protein [Flaviaesturariibacter flavus]TCJ13380.1 T9SS type B sorting domain-containing protein [Flaviaesturariibacter flavus]
MKKLLLFLVLTCCFAQVHAEHLKGGFFTYRNTGQPGSSPGTIRYEVTLTVYMICIPVGTTDPRASATVPVTIFNASTNTEINTIDFPKINQYKIGKSVPEPCVTNTPLNCYYEVLIYRSNVDLAPSAGGYVLSYQRCCRIIGISNLQPPSNAVGNTYSINIPGTNLHPLGPTNSSSTFLTNDTVVICRNSFFRYSFQATDPDGDELHYSFCDAWVGGGQSTGPGTGPNTAAPNPAAPPPYPLVSYENGFSGTTPLGPQVTIDPNTGVISGIGPEIGEYVITVCVEERRNGRTIGFNRKELHVKVADCSVVKATLDPSYVNCNDFNVQFSNNSPNGVRTSSWDFGVPGISSDTSSLAAPPFSYPDTGVYMVKLVVNRGDQCADSMTAPVRVFPGFFTNFNWKGVCANFPTRFFDSTTTRYGVVDKWSWDFGDLTTGADTSRLKNPTYTYPTPQPYMVRMIVGTSKGCLDTVEKQVFITDKPPLAIPARDTLMCSGDTMQLRAVGDGLFSWTPNTRMLNANTATPLTWPTVTTTYTVRLDADGCIATDTMQVRVVNLVTLRMPADTTICLTDTAHLYAFSNGLRYLWRPSLETEESREVDRFVVPTLAINDYKVYSRIGHCIDSGMLRVRTVPYPKITLMGDTLICFRASVQLQASHNGTSFEWNPKTWLTNANTLTPVARPPDTTMYVLTVRDTLSGCPKPSFDTVVVNVTPRIHASAGNDTAVIAGQPLQLQATGGVRYEWTPGTGLNRTDVANPIGFYDIDPEYIQYFVRVFDPYNCVDSACVRVRVFRTEPSIFVPTAFTPNHDGKNDEVKPIAVGMRTIRFFRIFNRWGQLVFETTVNGQGWDGTIKGKEQNTEVYVWVCEAEDFRGARYFRKGTVTLIR